MRIATPADTDTLTSPSTHDTGPASVNTICGGFNNIFMTCLSYKMR
jgi:hypothetical protein